MQKRATQEAVLTPDAGESRMNVEALCERDVVVVECRARLEELVSRPLRLRELPLLLFSLVEGSAAFFSGFRYAPCRGIA